jgi:acyl carrier protein
MRRALAQSLSGALDNVKARAALRGATRVGSGVRVFGWPRVACDGHLSIGSSTVLISTPAPVQLLVAAGASLTIGAGVVIESGATLRVHGRVQIGDGVRIGVGCIVDDDGAEPREIVVLDGAWIEDGGVLLGGTTVAAWSVVRQGEVAIPSMAPTSAGPLSGERVRALDDRIREVIAGVVPAAAAVERNAELTLVRGWDSLAALRILVALEKEFSVSLPYDLFTREATLESVTPLIASCAAEKRAHAA